MEKEKRKVSKRTIIIASILIILLGIPAAYFLLIRNQEDSRAWYSSSWMYRRAITVSGAGTTRTNEDVLVTIDTSALITASKLQNDCDDLRFIDSDDTSTISYWVEGGCNTTTTKVWVRIPSLPAAGKTIYVYYGNPSATNAEQSWTANFITLSDSACDNGWVRDSTFDNKFIYGSTTYGSTGGASLSHNHGGSFSIATSAASSYRGMSGDVDEISYVKPTETHTLTGTISTADSTPSYINTYVCKKNDLSTLTGRTFFSDSSTPSGWTRMSAYDSRFPVGYTSHGSTGGTSTHSHSYSSLSVGTSPISRAEIDGGSPGGSMASSGHIHTTITVSSNPIISHLPPYKKLLYIESPSLTTLNQTIISMASATPPLGWTQYSTMNNHFLMGSSSVDTGSAGNTSHTHSVGFTTNGPSGTIWKKIASLQAASDTHTHTASLNTSSQSNIPPYATAIYIKRKSSLTTTLGSEELDNQAPTAPTSLLSEGATNPTGVTDTTPEFSAIFNDPDTGDTSTKYEIEVNTNSSFTGTVMWDTGQQTMTSVSNGSRSQNISYSGTTLSLNGTTYYWRIRFWDQDNVVGTWSSTAQFTMNTPPSTPTSLQTEGATNPAYVTDTTPEFSAIYSDPNSDNSGYYQIQVNTNSSFTGTTMWDSGQQSITITSGSRSSNISYSGTTLSLNGTTYYWRIRFWDNHTTVGNWSTTNNFTMNTSPTQPTSPLTEGTTNPNKVTDTTPEFSAICQEGDGDDCYYYEIEVNTNSSFTGTVMWDTGQQTLPISTPDDTRIADISYAGTTLSISGTTYYWRIRMWDEYQSVSPWSTTSQFTMSGAPNQPTDLLTDGQTNPQYISSLTPKFSAIYSDPNADDGMYYEIEVNSDSSFTGTVMWDSGKTLLAGPTTSGTRCADIGYAGTTLTNSNNFYYWRIRFWDSDDNVSTWSSTAVFNDNVQHFYFEGLKMEGILIDPIDEGGDGEPASPI